MGFHSFDDQRMLVLIQELVIQELVMCILPIRETHVSKNLVLLR
jgi:hypothetical protein